MEKSKSKYYELYMAFKAANPSLKGTEIQEKVIQNWLQLKSDVKEGNLSKYKEEMNAPK